MIINKLTFDILRAKKQLTIRDIAMKARCNSNSLCKHPISVSPLTAGRIANVLGVELEDLLGGDVDETSNNSRGLSRD